MSDEPQYRAPWEDEPQDPVAWEAAPRRRSLGARSQARLKHRRSRRMRLLLGALVLALAIPGLVFAAASQGIRLSDFRLSDIRFPKISLPFLDNDEGRDAQSEAGVPVQQTWLLIGTVEADPSGEAHWISLVSWDRKERRGFVLYIPRSTLVEIPGYGGAPDALAKAMALGREPLQTSTVSNLLGVRLDHHLKISDQAIRALFDKVGGLELDIQSKLSRTEPDGRVQLVFAEGRQHLSGERVAEYLTYVEETGDEISRAVRHATVWSALFEKFRKEGGAQGFRQLMEGSMDLFGTSAEPAVLGGFFENFVAASPENVIFETMPVTAQGIETGSQLYRPDLEGVQRMVERYLAASRPEGAGQPGRRVQILNGNGVPGVGQDVAKALIPKGFRVVLDANAKSFDYEVTQIVVYSDSKETLAIAEEVREALGTGEILISRQPQSVVDVTIVVGKDYPKR